MVIFLYIMKKQAREIGREEPRKIDGLLSKFRCDNGGCSNRSWNSKKVVITIRGYPKNRYNAVIFN